MCLHKIRLMSDNFYTNIELFLHCFHDYGSFPETAVNLLQHSCLYLSMVSVGLVSEPIGSIESLNGLNGLNIFECLLYKTAEHFLELIPLYQE